LSLTTSAEILARAEKGGYAVGAFNCNNMEIIQAIIDAAEAENSPVIIQASQGAIKYAGIGYIVALIREAALNSRVPVAMHLDHGTDFRQVLLCIRIRFYFSYDRWFPHYPIQKKILRLTSKVVEMAHAVGRFCGRGAWPAWEAQRMKCTGGRKRDAFFY
jgi:fructose-bisphosphate aldolase class II